MSKVNRLICLDFDINSKLSKHNNASGLINELLIRHFCKLENNGNPEEIEIKVSKEIDLLQEQLKRLQEVKNEALKVIEEKRLKELEDEKIQTQQYLDRKNAEIIRAKVKKEFEKQAKEGKVSPGMDSWEQFYKDNINNYKEVQN